MAPLGEWHAFALQAQADYSTYLRLTKVSDAPDCHRLQFLHMACEKLSKACLLRAGFEIRKTHGYLKTQLPQLARDVLSKRARGINGAPFIRSVTHIAQELEFLSPARDFGNQRPDNCEYPWNTGGTTGWVAPVFHDFTMTRLLRQPHGLQFLNLVLPQAIDGLLNAS